MITKWQLFNFKSVREAVDLELGPLTIFAGSNSSGKSTILQSMLLVSQTLSSKVSSRSVVLNGPILRLGQFDDLKSFDSNANQILIGFTCRPIRVYPRQSSGALASSRVYPIWLRGMPESVLCEFSFDVEGGSEQLEVSQLRPSLFGCRIEASANFGKDSSTRLSLSLTRTNKSLLEKSKDVLPDERVESLLQTLSYDVAIDPSSGSSEDRLEEAPPFEETPQGELVGVQIDHFLPKRLTYKFDPIQERVRALVDLIYSPPDRRPTYRRGVGRWVVPLAVVSLIKDRTAFDIDMPQQKSLFEDEGVSIDELGFGLRRAKQQHKQQTLELPDDPEALALEIQKLLIQGVERGFMLTAPSLPSPLKEGVSYLEDYFSNRVKYLGPLRDEPKPLYPLVANVDPSDIGLRGEHTASVLDLYKDESVRFISPRSLMESGSQKRVTNRSLKTAVLEWLQYMDVVQDIETRDRGKLGHELKVTTPGTKMSHDLTHVGVGVSQVLPILVMCLLAEPDTTIIIEQPELHLHPKVQTLLGDFFLSMAMLDKQIIVETHSEYIINRLRYRAAAADGERFSSLMKIYFAEKYEGSSVFRKVNVNRYGAILDWPEGFFDQSQQEAEEIVRAASRKRRTEREAKQDG